MSLVDRAKELRSQVEIMAQSLDDTNSLKVKELFPNWKEDFSYEVGEKVRHENILYKCLIAHTSQSDWTPSDSPSLWTRVLIPDPEVIPDWVQPESTNPYMKGDKVKHNEKIWISDVDNNVWEPGIYGWSEVI